jgi:hypothetical protein
MSTEEARKRKTSEKTSALVVRTCIRKWHSMTCLFRKVRATAKRPNSPAPKNRRNARLARLRLGRMFSGMGNRFSLAIALSFEDTGACARGTHLVHGSAGDDKERREEELERVLPDLPLDGGDGLAHGARLPDRHATSGFCSLSRF